MSEESAPATHAATTSHAQKGNPQSQQSTGWSRLFSSRKAPAESSWVDPVKEYKDGPPIEKWSLGILNDRETVEVPGQCRGYKIDKQSNIVVRHCPASSLKTQ